MHFSGRIAGQFSRIIYYPAILQEARVNTRMRHFPVYNFLYPGLTASFPLWKSRFRTGLIHIVSPAAFRTQHSPVVDFEIIAHQAAGITYPC